MADSFPLKAIITVVDQVSDPLKEMQPELKRVQKEMAGLALAAEASGKAILNALAMPVNSAIGFESTMADIRKAIVGLYDENAFAQMGDDILTLSTRLPVTAQGIAEIAAAGAQAGIARNDLMQFASEAVKMGVAFNTTADESGRMMAQWRTAFKLTQDEAVVLADKINALGNTDPAKAKKIADIVTRIGPLGRVAGAASGEMAAMAATFAGMGVTAETASGSIKNVMLSLSAGRAATKSQRRALAFLKLNPARLAADMQNNSRAAMLKVLDSLAKVPKAKQANMINALFGRESFSAIAPLLTNLHLLRTNFNRVADAQKYGGSVQKSYASYANTTENQLIMLKNSTNAIAVTLGETFLPAINRAAKGMMPYLDYVREFVRANPALVQSVAKMGGALLAVGVSIGTVSRAINILNSVINLSVAKLAIAALAAGAMLLIENWDEVGPIITSVWHEIDRVVQSLGGWEETIKGIAAIAALSIGVRMVSNIGAAISMQQQWTQAAQVTGRMLGGLGKISLIAGLVELGLMAQKFEKQHPWLINNVVADALNSGFGLNEKMGQWGRDFHDFVYQKTGWQMPRGDDYLSSNGYQPVVPLNRPATSSTLNSALAPAVQRGELKVTFDNAPPGMRVIDMSSTANPQMNIFHDVGYSPFRRHN